MEKNKNAGFLPRVIAFILDMIIISFVASLISLPFIDQDNTEKISNEVSEVVEKAASREIDMDTYITELKPLIYQSDRANGVYTIAILIISILYFVVYQFYTKQTIGKKIMKIRIEANDGELTMNHFVFRGLIINSILFTLITFIFVIFANENVYFATNMTLNSIYYLIVLVSSFMIMFRKDRRGLHDFICNTKVVKC